ncbi:MAG: amidohydrolase [Firmicutes bacterium]|nr:amidohydrolase [Bacillota bacterium]
MDYLSEISALLEGRKEEFFELSDRIWDFAESRFQEFQSSRLDAEYLKSQGFKVKLGVADEDTALVAEYGSGKPVIGFLGEYDALSGLSQQADVSEHCPIEAGADGHGCGHNLLGTADLAAAVAVKELIEQGRIKGTVRFYGCPAEENAAGKSFMVRAGLFDDCDICLTWHPGWANQVNGNGSLANIRVFYTFHGLSSHAAGAPQLGRSALDAVELMDVGVNYMREHMSDEARIHYAITDTGGTAPNVVQARAQVLYAIRAPRMGEVMELFGRVSDCAKGAALMTQTKVDIRQVSACYDCIGNDVIADRFMVHMDEILPIEYTEEELAYAKRFQEAITELDRSSLKAKAKKVAGKDAAKLLEQPIWNFRLPGYVKNGGSTDVGNVSWVVPTAQFGIATLAAGTPGHAWQVVAQGKGSVAKKGMLAAAKLLAVTACDFFADEALVKAAKAELAQRLEGETDPNALPRDLKPEIW